MKSITKNMQQRMISLQLNLEIQKQFQCQVHFLISLQIDRSYCCKNYTMDVLGRERIIRKANKYATQKRSQGQNPPPKRGPYHQQNAPIEQRNKNLSSTSNKNITWSCAIQEFKQNNIKGNVFRQLQQLNKANLNTKSFMTPFTPVINRTVDSDVVSLRQNNLKAQNQSNRRNIQQGHGSRFTSKQIIQKLAENKFNNMIERKRKSISHRVPVPMVKENNVDSVNQLNTFVQTNGVARKQRKQKQIEENVQFFAVDQQSKDPQVNRQKSTHSFMIRKKINCNLLQNNKGNKDSNNTKNCVKKSREDRFITDQKLVKNTEEEFIRSKVESQTTSRFKVSRTQIYEQIKSPRQKHQLNDIHINPTPTRPVKSTNIRVSKPIKQHEPFTYGQNLTQPINSVQLHKNPAIDKNNEPIQSHQVLNTDLQSVEAQLSQQDKVNEANNVPQNTNVHTSDQNKSEVSQHPQPTINKQNLRPQQSQRDSHEQQVTTRYKQQQVTTRYNQQQLRARQKQQQVRTRQKQSILQSPKSIQGTQNIKCRRGRMTSIRAMKNYYKHLEAEEKSQVITEQRQVCSTRKKQKQMACLTHKIKWGHASKKKLNSDRNLHFFNLNPVISGPRTEQRSQNSGNQYQQLDHAKMRKQKEIKLQENQVEQMQPRERKGERKPSCKNLIKNLAQTIQSRYFIDGMQIPYPNGSKSLLMFQDPGISVIVNTHNSRHQVPYSPGAFTTIEKECIQRQQRNYFQTQNLSPVRKMRKRSIEQPQLQSHDNYPLESLKELYFQLKSRQELNAKPIQENLRMDSLQQLFQDQI